MRRQASDTGLSQTYGVYGARGGYYAGIEEHCEEFDDNIHVEECDDLLPTWKGGFPFSMLPDAGTSMDVPTAVYFTLIW